MILLVLLVFGASSYAFGLWNLNQDAKASSGALAPCPYTSNIPDYVPAGTTYNTAPAYQTASANLVTSYTVSQANFAYASASISFVPGTQYSNRVVFCDKKGYGPNPEMTACVPVQIPAHAHLNLWGDGYDCDMGYNTLGNSCVPDSYYGSYKY